MCRCVENIVISCLFLFVVSPFICLLLDLFMENASMCDTLQVIEFLVDELNFLFCIFYGWDVFSYLLMFYENHASCIAFGG